MTRGLLLSLLCAACGAGGDDPADAGPDGDADAEVDVSDLEISACADDAHVGGFEVQLAGEFTSVQGRVYDRVSPTSLFEAIATEGPCRLLRAPVLFCDPECEARETCGPDGNCSPFPESQDLGVVTVRGLAVPVEMEPLPPGFFYSNSGTLPHPGFAPGAGIALSAAGGAGDPLSLRGVGVAQLTGVAAAVPVERGHDLVLTWDPPAEAAPIDVVATLNLNQHGLTGSRLVCEVPDTGGLTVPESLVSALVDDGLSGFPSLVLRRRSVDSTTRGGGCVDLQVFTTVEVPVEIPGLTSCSDDQDCPEGETCRGDLTCAPDGA